MADIHIPPSTTLSVRITGITGITGLTSTEMGSVDAPNRALNGHKLLIQAPWSPPAAFLDKVRRDHPGLVIVYRELGWGQKLAPEAFSREDWADVTVLFTGSSLPDPDEAPKLEYVQLSSAGANHILKHPLFLDTDVTFCTANGVHGPQISEWIICTFLAFQHHIPQYLELQREARWKRLTTDVEDAVGQRVGILGYGSIGRQTARVAKAMGMDVYAYTLHPRDTPESRRDDSYAPPGTGDPDGVFPSKWFSGGSTADLHAFLSSGLDLLVVATPLTKGTTHLLGAAEFELLADRRTFVSNIARGPVVDTAAIIDALDRGRLRGAALDVTDPEPLPDGHPLWSAKNVIVTPHISGASTSYGERVYAILEYNLDRLAEGQPLTNRVSRKEGY